MLKLLVKSLKLLIFKMGLIKHFLLYNKDVIKLMKIINFLKNFGFRQIWVEITLCTY